MFKIHSNYCLERCQDEVGGAMLLCNKTDMGYYLYNLETRLRLSGIEALNNPYAGRFIALGLAWDCENHCLNQETLKQNGWSIT